MELSPLAAMRRSDEVEDLEVAVRSALEREDVPEAKKLLQQARALLYRLENDLP